MSRSPHPPSGPLGRLWTRVADGVYTRFHSRFLSDVVFVHINKTGGSSIEQALGLPFQHKTAVELRRMIGAPRFGSRFKFAVVRNPWDKVVSHYHYRSQTNQTGLGGAPIDFREWVRRAYGEQDPKYYDLPKMFMTQMDWLCDVDGTNLMDFIAHFESLEADFNEVCRAIGRTAALPHRKSSTRQRDFRAYYDDPTAEIVGRWFSKDLDALGYSFDTAAPARPVRRTGCR